MKVTRSVSSKKGATQAAYPIKGAQKADKVTQIIQNNNNIKNLMKNN